MICFLVMPVLSSLSRIASATASFVILSLSPTTFLQPAIMAGNRAASYGISKSAHHCVVSLELFESRL